MRYSGRAIWLTPKLRAAATPFSNRADKSANRGLIFLALRPCHQPIRHRPRAVRNPESSARSDWESSACRSSGQRLKVGTMTLIRGVTNGITDKIGLAESQGTAVDKGLPAHLDKSFHLLENCSTIILATPFIMRCPTLAMRPPTLASVLYLSIGLTVAFFQVDGDVALHETGSARTLPAQKHNATELALSLIATLPLIRAFDRRNADLHDGLELIRRHFVHALASRHALRDDFWSSKTRQTLSRGALNV